VDAAEDQVKKRDENDILAEAHREIAAVSGEVSLALTRRRLPGRSAPENWARRLEATARLMRICAPKPVQERLL
jgi:hypothetical protein